VLGYFLCYYQNLGLIGIWLGWMVGMIMNLIISINRLRSKDIELRITDKPPFKLKVGHYIDYASSVSNGATVKVIESIDEN